MPVINFNEVFAARVMSGEIRRTIRPGADNILGNNAFCPEVGKDLYFFAGIEPHEREMLATATCTACTRIAISAAGQVLFAASLELVFGEALTELAISIGCRNGDEMIDDFSHTYGLPFHGLLIEWGDLR